MKKIETAYDVLAEVLELVERDPARFDMSNFFRAWEASDDIRAKNSAYGAKPECGTIGCICGWAGVVLGEVNKDGWSDTDSVPRVLGLLDRQRKQLFFPEELTSIHGIKTRTRLGPEAHAEAIKCHLAKFMQENEAQLKAKKVTLKKESPYHADYEGANRKFFPVEDADCVRE